MPRDREVMGETQATSSTPPRPLLPIPVATAQHIAEEYGYDQVIIVARRVGSPPSPHGEHVTTYGRGWPHNSVAGRIGKRFQQLMEWPEADQTTPPPPPETLSSNQLKHVVNRFLNWRLPRDFSPDCGITAKRPDYAPEVDWTPTGTNLLDAQQTEEMIRYIFQGLPGDN